VYVLQYFYELTNVSVDGKTLLASAEELSIKPITWPLFGDNVTKQLTADDKNLTHQKNCYLNYKMVQLRSIIVRLRLYWHNILKPAAQVNGG